MGHIHWAQVVQRGPDFERRVDILCKKMDSHQSGLIHWDDFCSHFMQDLTEKHSLSNEREIPLLVCPHLFDNPHRGILRTITSTPNPARIVTASEEGTIVFWSMKMQPQRCWIAGRRLTPTSTHKRTDTDTQPQTHRRRHTLATLVFLMFWIWPGEAESGSSLQFFLFDLAAGRGG